MDTLRNVSGQPFLLMKQGGGSVHLFPGRAVILSEEEMKSSQVRQLVDGGFARVERPGKPEKTKPKPGKGEKRGDKKRPEN
jgi:hypothetical protein